MKFLHEKFKKEAENLIREKLLVIKNVEYEILSVSIHAQWPGHRDPIVQTKDPRHSERWFFYQNDYSSYLDYDITNHYKETQYDQFYFVNGGIRINCIRNTQDGTLIKTCKAVYELIDEGIKTSYKYKNIGQDSTPLLFLKNRDQTNTSPIFEIPRFGDFKKYRLKTEDQLKHLFTNMMLTTTTECIFDCQYSQYYPTVIAFNLIEKDLELIKNEITTEKKIKTYMDTFNAGRGKSFKELDKTMGSKSMCEMYGYFYNKGTL